MNTFNEASPSIFTDPVNAPLPRRMRDPREIILPLVTLNSLIGHAEAELAVWIERQAAMPEKDFSHAILGWRHAVYQLKKTASAEVL